MNAGGASRPWSDVALALELFAADPHRLGGIVLRGGPGPARDHTLSTLASDLGASTPLLRMPVHISDESLLGGLSLAATMSTGRVVEESGLLARAHGGVIVVPMAELLEPHVAGALTAALDTGLVMVEREGVSRRHEARFGLVLLDEGIGEESVPGALRDRLAFSFSLDVLGRPPSCWPAGRDAIAAASRFGPSDVAALCEAASALGVHSPRASLLAARVALASARLAGRVEVGTEDLAVAARLVLAPRATQAPAAPSSEPEPDEPRERPTQESDRGEQEQGELQEMLVEAARAALPPDLLELLASGSAPRRRSAAGGRAGPSRRATEARGRPAGVAARAPARGERLHLVETLRACAPWQRLRKSSLASAGRAPRRVEIRKSDLRVTRVRSATETTVILCVDASGSTALERLAEAKGAALRLLGDCYARRDHVAVVGFRGDAASVLLAPTRSLTRASRALDGLVGGGATPLASGLAAALELALGARERGRSPLVVLLSDARPNVALDGARDRERAGHDAHGRARAIRAAEVPSLLLDTSARPSAGARLLAATMSARYVPLPRVEASEIATHVSALARSGSRVGRDPM